MGGPWCYINLKSWAYCDISVCKNKGRTPGLTSFKQKHEKVKTLQDEEHFYVTDLITIYQPITKYYTDYSTTTTTSVTTRLAELAHYVRMIDHTSDNVKQFYTRCRYTAIRPTHPVIFQTDLKMICEQILYEKNNTVSVLK
ncbi:uncharacterized protein TRIADDRAFT_61766 [Trichoplax adhaerens]|uniref:Uncharacterized protein n=1 Tax=Trichoplax adhaerens TaxID=10228 RepID=B3SBX1_TRIAD|nr:predicted protein [Trichoplax adhaerens]EDV19748.1 predicted protein [Trichoplax adhaerens]|eukprot:XP_002117772.1 predicted protein [Trichoplax adhaerens]